MQIKKIEDTNATTSEKSGIAGFLETFLRRFRNVGFLVFLMPITLLGILTIGISLIPGVCLFKIISDATQNYSWQIQYICLGISLGAGYLFYGVSVIFVAPFFNFILPFRIRPTRGPWFSLASVPWYYHNALTYIVRYTALDLFTPSPLSILFYKLMGMKIGKGVIINTTNISDPGLITLEDYVMIGGNVNLFAHYAMKGFLVKDRVHIKKGANIGFGATVMGNVVIGNNVVVSPHAVVLPGARIDNDVKIPDCKCCSMYIKKDEEKPL